MLGNQEEIDQWIEKFPEEFAERKLENDTMTNFGVDMMPLFVMDGVLPFQKFLLPIFEPRYRLMIFAYTLSLKQQIRSIMEGNCRMGTDIYPPEWSREREQTE
ncbi:unnamed protein product [Prunus armeniaca]